MMTLLGIGDQAPNFKVRGIVGAFKGRLAGQSLAVSGGKFFVIAVSAAGLGYLIGLAVQFFFPGIAISA